MGLENPMKTESMQINELYTHQVISRQNAALICLILYFRRAWVEKQKISKYNWLTLSVLTKKIGRLNLPHECFLSEVRSLGECPDMDRIAVHRSPLGHFNLG